jgi:hypothetical protein
VETLNIKAALCLPCLLIFACEKKPKVNFETAEESRKIARENSGALARQFRADSKLDDYDLNLRGDSTITNDCPQGDGWASIDLVNRKTSETIKLKCSTVSQGMGCLMESDFKQRGEYANQDGKCNNEIPFPLPKIFN